MAKSRRPRLPILSLPEGWWSLLDQVADDLGVGALDGEALARALRDQSAAYTRRGAVGPDAPPDRPALAARLRFFLTRDMAKLAGPLEHLSLLGALPGGARWRVLDLGAGMGGSALGVARYLADRPGAGLTVRSVEQHGPLGRAAAQLARGASALDGFAPVSLRVEQGDLRRYQPPEGGPFDLVLVGFALNELYLDLPAAQRRDKQVALLERWASWLADDGVLLVLEPALRPTARALSDLRDQLVAGGRSHVLAPCVGAPRCPMLQVERDWCHGELPVALPERLAALARSAGLRFERLTYSYLALGRRPPRLPACAPGGALYRVVSAPLPSKGKLEWFGCGAAGRARLTRLRRDRASENADFEAASRGDLVCAGSLEPRGGGLFVRNNSSVRLLRPQPGDRDPSPPSPRAV